MPSNDDPTLADKEAILASLNIKAMTFDDTIGVLSHSENIYSTWIICLHLVACQPPVANQTVLSIKIIAKNGISQFPKSQKLRQRQTTSPPWVPR